MGRVENAAQPVSADQVAALRAYLSGDQEMFQHLNRMLDRSRASARAYRALLIGVFAEAVTLRFGEQTPRTEVIDYVAELRCRNDDIAEGLDPDHAERIIMAAIADEDIDDLSGDERVRLEMILMLAFVQDAHFSGARLDSFLERSRTFANAILA